MTDDPTALGASNSIDASIDFQNGTLDYEVEDVQLVAQDITGNDGTTYYSNPVMAPAPGEFATIYFDIPNTGAMQAETTYQVSTL